MKREIKQGTIIYGVRSTKYPENKCYSIIISARCDVSNGKIEKLYYITALDVEEWLCTKKGFDIVYKKEIASGIKNILDSKKINLSVLMELSEDDKKQLLSQYKDSDQEKILDFLNCDDVQIRKKLIKKNSKVGYHFLRDINESKQYHFFFLPELAYLENNRKDKGLIVDLQEIDYYIWDDIEKIKSPGIDMMILDEEKDKYKVERWKEIFWLQDKDDFVDVERTIVSPWCELLMQRFAIDFIRIGVDRASDKDLKSIIDRI